MKYILFVHTVAESKKAAATEGEGVVPHVRMAATSGDRAPVHLCWEQHEEKSPTESALFATHVDS